jgi:hypothetical protein
MKTFSPHQIAWHSISLFRGARILDLVRSGMKIEPVAASFADCRTFFENLDCGKN